MPQDVISYVLENYSFSFYRQFVTARMLAITCLRICVWSGGGGGGGRGVVICICVFQSIPFILNAEEKFICLSNSSTKNVPRNANTAIMKHLKFLVITASGN